MYVLDTNVVSELRRARPHAAVVNWIAGVPSSSLHIASVSAGEIQSGIELTRKRDAARAEEIERWLDELIRSVTVLDATAAIFRIWAKLMLKQPDHLIEDALIAATAIDHEMTVVTRNVSDFNFFNVKLFNPFNFAG